MSGKAIAIGVLVLAAIGIVYYIVAGNKSTPDTDTSTLKDNTSDTRKPGYVSGAEVDPYNILSTDPNDLVANPAYTTWQKVSNELVKAGRFDDTITLPPAPPKYIYR